MLPDTEMHVVSAVVLEAVVPMVLQQRYGGGRQVRRAAGECVNSLDDGVHHTPGCLPRCHGLIARIEEVIQVLVPAPRELSGKLCLKLLGVVGIRFAVRIQAGLPLSALALPPLLGLPEVRQRIKRHGERVSVGSAQVLLGEADLLLGERLAVGRRRPCLVGAAIADHRPADDQAWALGLRLCLANGSIRGLGVHAVDGPDHMPVVGLEALGDVLGEGDVRVALDGDVIVIVEID